MWQTCAAPFVSTNSSIPAQNHILLQFLIILALIVSASFEGTHLLLCCMLHFARWQIL